jgi:iron-sulfur cluster repair protein YtfE (RIC family)
VETRAILASADLDLRTPVRVVGAMTPEDLQKSIEPVKDDARILADELHTLEEMVAMLKQRDQKESQYLQVLDHLRHFFLTDLMQHMLHEEQVFFPAVQQLPQGYWKVVRLRKEHGELRDAIEGFRTALTLESYLGPGTREQALWRLVNEAGAILAMLRAHASFEIELSRELQEQRAG